MNSKELKDIIQKAILNEFETIMIKHDSDNDYDRGFYNALNVAEEVVKRHLGGLDEVQ